MRARGSSIEKLFRSRSRFTRLPFPSRFLSQRLRLAKSAWRASRLINANERFPPRPRNRRSSARSRDANRFPAVGRKIPGGRGVTPYRREGEDSYDVISLANDYPHSFDNASRFVFASNLFFHSLSLSLSLRTDERVYRSDERSLLGRYLRSGGGPRRKRDERRSATMCLRIISCRNRIYDTGIRAGRDKGLRKFSAVAGSR